MAWYRYDDLLEQHLGMMGRYQYLVATLCSLDSFTYALYVLLPIFISSTPPHVCTPPVPPGINCTLEEYHTWVRPQKCTPEAICNPDPCRTYTINSSMLVSNCTDGSNRVDVGQTQACTSWTYGESFYSDSLVKEVRIFLVIKSGIAWLCNMAL